MMAERTYADELIEESRGHRSTVVAKVRQLGGVRTAFPVLRDLVQKAPLSDLRAAAAEALGHLHSSEAEEILILLLKQDRDWHVRNAALWTLARLATPGAILAVQEAPKDRAYGVREDARVLLEQLQGKKDTR